MLVAGGLIDEQRGDAFYNDFYRRGGWKYSFRREYAWHKRHVMRRFRLRRGMSILEVACGSGFHTNVFNRMGLRCVGIDRSVEGIVTASREYPHLTFYQCDFREIPLPKASFDAVIARGFSYYHYDMNSAEAMLATRTLVRYLAPGGVFIMIIVTDLSGRREPGSIWHNTLDDYRAHFSSFGGQWSVDWVDGVAICGLSALPLDENCGDQETNAGGRLTQSAAHCTS